MNKRTSKNRNTNKVSSKKKQSNNNKNSGSIKRKNSNFKQEHMQRKGPSKGPAKNAAEPTETRLLMLNKPFEVLCQFTDTDGRVTLADYVKQPGFYPAGRLDRDSEGLLLLTNNGILQHRISNPEFKLEKQYLVQVEGIMEIKALRKLQLGVDLKDGKTAPAKALAIEPPNWIWERNPPIRSRKDKPTSWIQLTITEGRNRQVRRMTAAVGHPTLRLIRSKIGNVSIEQLAPGEYKEIEPIALHR